MSKGAEAGRAWLEFVDEHGAMDIADRPPIPPINFDEVADAIREAGGLEEIPALYLLDLLAEAEAARTQLGRSVLQARERAETADAEVARMAEIMIDVDRLINRAPREDGLLDEAEIKAEIEWALIEPDADVAEALIDAL